MTDLDYEDDYDDYFYIDYEEVFENECNYVFFVMVIYKVSEEKYLF